MGSDFWKPEIVLLDNNHIAIAIVIAMANILHGSCIITISALIVSRGEIWF